MLSDDNIEAVVSFLPDVKTMATFASTGRLAKDMVYASIPAAIQSAKPNMTILQKDTLCELSENPGLGHLKAIIERKCLVCKKDFKGAIRAPWGIPAHVGCNKRLGTSVKLIKWGIPTEIMSLVRATIPVKVTEGSTPIWETTVRVPYTSEKIVVRPIPGVIPENMTLEHFEKIGQNEVNTWMEAQDAKITKRKLEDEECRITRRRICKEKKVERRVEIEGIVKTSYLKWVRTVPPKAKRFVSKLEGWASVEAVTVINANADLPDEVHNELLSRYFIRQPSVAELTEAYTLVKEYPEEIWAYSKCGTKYPRFLLFSKCITCW